MKAVQGAIKSFDMTDDVIRLEVVAAPFGGPNFLGGKDLQGEFFTKNTDFGLNPAVPVRVYYEHALHPVFAKQVLGLGRPQGIVDDGVLYILEIERSHKYSQVIESLIRDNALGVSSQPVMTTVDIDEMTGEIKSWHIGEVSLTPIPANPLAVVRAMKSLGILDGETMEEDEQRDLEQEEASVEHNEESADAQEDAADKAASGIEAPEEEKAEDLSEEINAAFDAADDKDEAAEEPVESAIPEADDRLDVVMKALLDLTAAVNDMKANYATREELDAVQSGIKSLQDGLKTFSTRVAKSLSVRFDRAVDDATEMSRAELEAKSLVRKTGGGSSGGPKSLMFGDDIPDAPGIN